MTRIVVGTDGSDGSTRALRWAVGEARLRDADVDLVHAYSPVPPMAGAMMEGYAIPPEVMEESAEAVLQETVRAAGDTDGVLVNRRAVMGSASRVLCDAAEGADLLVVGTRGLGGFRGLLLGAVSQQVASHSPCPVVLVGPGTVDEDES